MSKRHQSFSAQPHHPLKDFYCNEKRRIPEIIRKCIHELISKNDLGSAAALLYELAEIYAPSRVNQILIICREIIEIEDAARINTIDPGDISRGRNRLSLSILDITDMICSS